MPEPLEAQSQEVASEDPFVGRLVGGHFRICKLLGRGGTSAVYLAKDENLDRDVAIKLLDLTSGDTKLFLDRFKREATAGSTMEHEGIVKTLAVGQFEERPYLVMEFLTGTTLAQILAKGRMEPILFKTVFLQVMEALAYAHSKGVYHRDIKPSNIVVEQEGTTLQVKIVDFGIAKVADRQEQKLTQTGAIIGSAPYMSPEQCTGSPTDSRTDIYSLGCVMYEALAGAPPFESDGAFELMYKHVHEVPPPLHTKNPAVDKALEDLIARTLAKDPNQRFQTAEEMREALSKIKFSQPAHPGDRRLAFAFAGAAMVAVVVVVGTTLAYKHWASLPQLHQKPPQTAMLSHHFSVLKRQVEHLASERVRRYDEAIALVRQWLEHNEGNPRVGAEDKAEAKLFLARTLHKKNLNNDAIKVLASIRDNKKLSAPLRLKVLLLLELAYWDSAETHESYKAALEARQVYLPMLKTANTNSLRDISDVAGDLCRQAFQNAHYDLAIQAGEENIGVYLRRRDSRKDYKIDTLKYHAMALAKLGRVAEAESLFKRRLQYLLDDRPIEEGLYSGLSAALRDLAIFYSEHGQPDKGLAAVEQADRYLKKSPKGMLVESLCNELQRAVCYRVKGDYKREHQILDDLITRSDKVTDEVLKQAIRLDASGEMLCVPGYPPAKAKAVLEGCFAYYRNHRTEHSNMAFSATRLAKCYEMLGAPSQAEQVLREAAEAWKDDPFEHVGLYALLGTIDGELYFRPAQDIARRLLSVESVRNPQSLSTAHLLWQVGVFELRNGNLAEAKRLAQRSIKLTEKSPDQELVSALDVLIDALKQEKKFAEGLKEAEKWEPVISNCSCGQLAHFYMLKRELLLHENRYDDAITAANKAFEHYSKVKDPNGQASAVYGLADIYEKKEDFKNANRCIDEAIGYWSTTGETKLIAVAYVKKHLVSSAAGRLDLAREAIMNAEIQARKVPEEKQLARDIKFLQEKLTHL